MTDGSMIIYLYGEEIYRRREKERFILEEFKKVADKLGENEFLEIKEKLIGNYHIGQEDSQIQMLNLLGSEIHGDASAFYNFEKNISAVKLKDLKELAKKASEKYSFFALVPG